MLPLFVAGTRPEIIKLWPVYLQFQKQGIKPTWVHSGQHDAMALPLYEALGITPDILIELPPRGSDLATLGSLLLLRLGEVMEVKPDVTIVQGDTHTVLYASLAAFYLGIPIAHVEAGLRTNDLASPFPEEANRQMVARIITYHFCPTSQAVINLYDEGVSALAIHRVGNTIVDAITTLAGSIPPVAEGYILATLHRRENQEELEKILSAINQIANEQHPVYLPVHLSPAVKDKVCKVLRDNPDAYLIEPQLYPDFVKLMCGANVIITDSGGVQEEAVTLGIPLVVCRDTTERPEAINGGVGVLAGRDPKVIAEHAEKMFYEGRRYPIRNPFGDGKAAGRIVEVLYNNGK
jgi:UDP-N-acetylglucosamine 2-epimerase (non-hydrolysing)